MSDFWLSVHKPMWESGWGHDSGVGAGQYNNAGTPELPPRAAGVQGELRIVWDPSPTMGNKQGCQANVASVVQDTDGQSHHSGDQSVLMT